MEFVSEISVERAEKLICEENAVVIDFYTSWCKPCKIAKAALERIAQELAEKGVKIFRLDVDKAGPEGLHRRLRLREPIRVVPTIVIFRYGAEVGRFIGASSEPDYADKLKQFILSFPGGERRMVEKKRIFGRMSEEDREAFRRLGVGPFILGILAQVAKQGQSAKELLKQTPWFDLPRRRYLKHVIEEGEKARKILDECLRRLKEIREQIKREKLVESGGGETR